MRSNRITAVVSLVLGLVGSLAAVGCKDDTAGPANTNIAGMGGGAGTGTTGMFSAKVLDPQTMVPVPTTTVKALDNATGAPLGKEAISATDGAISFEGLPAGKVAFVSLGKTGMTIDTYQYNIDSSAANEQVWVVAKSTADIVPSLAAFTPNLEKAAISGAVYWINGAGAEEPVGCATVTFAGTGDAADIRYFDGNNLPTALTNRTNSNPLNGRYFIGNAPTGSQKVSVQVGGTEMGSTTLMLFARKQASDGEESVCISNIYIEAAKNPTPAGCM